MVHDKIRIPLKGHANAPAGVSATALIREFQLLPMIPSFSKLSPSIVSNSEDVSAAFDCPSTKLLYLLLLSGNSPSFNQVSTPLTPSQFYHSLLRALAQLHPNLRSALANAKYPLPSSQNSESKSKDAASSVRQASDLASNLLPILESLFRNLFLHHPFQSGKSSPPHTMHPAPGPSDDWLQVLRHLLTHQLPAAPSALLPCSLRNAAWRQYLARYRVLPHTLVSGVVYIPQRSIPPRGAKKSGWKHPFSGWMHKKDDKEVWWKGWGAVEKKWESREAAVKALQQWTEVFAQALEKGVPANAATAAGSVFPSTGASATGTGGSFGDLGEWKWSLFTPLDGPIKKKSSLSAILSPPGCTPSQAYSELPYVHDHNDPQMLPVLPQYALKLYNSQRDWSLQQPPVAEFPLGIHHSLQPFEAIEQGSWYSSLKKKLPWKGSGAAVAPSYDDSVSSNIPAGVISTPNRLASISALGSTPNAASTSSIRARGVYSHLTLSMLEEQPGGRNRSSAFMEQELSFTPTPHVHDSLGELVTPTNASGNHMPSDQASVAVTRQIIESFKTLGNAPFNDSVAQPLPPAQSHPNPVRARDESTLYPLHLWEGGTLADLQVSLASSSSLNTTASATAVPTTAAVPALNLGAGAFHDACKEKLDGNTASTGQNSTTQEGPQLLPKSKCVVSFAVSNAGFQQQWQRAILLAVQSNHLYLEESLNFTRGLWLAQRQDSGNIVKIAREIVARRVKKYTKPLQGVSSKRCFFATAPRGRPLFPLPPLSAQGTRTNPFVAAPSSACPSVHSPTSRGGGGVSPSPHVYFATAASAPISPAFSHFYDASLSDYASYQANGMFPRTTPLSKGRFLRRNKRADSQQSHSIETINPVHPLSTRNLALHANTPPPPYSLLRGYLPPYAPDADTSPFPLMDGLRDYARFLQFCGVDASALTAFLRPIPLPYRSNAHLLRPERPILSFLPAIHRVHTTHLLREEMRKQYKEGRLDVHFPVLLPGGHRVLAIVYQDHSPSAKKIRAESASVRNSHRPSNRTLGHPTNGYYSSSTPTRAAPSHASNPLFHTAHHDTAYASRSTSGGRRLRSASTHSAAADDALQDRRYRVIPPEEDGKYLRNALPSVVYIPYSQGITVDSLCEAILDQLRVFVDTPYTLSLVAPPAKTHPVPVLPTATPSVATHSTTTTITATTTANPETGAANFPARLSTPFPSVPSVSEGEAYRAWTPPSTGMLVPMPAYFHAQDVWTDKAHATRGNALQKCPFTGIVLYPRLRRVGGHGGAGRKRKTTHPNAQRGGPSVQPGDTGVLPQTQNHTRSTSASVHSSMSPTSYATVASGTTTISASTTSTAASGSTQLRTSPVSRLPDSGGVVASSATLGVGKEVAEKAVPIEYSEKYRSIFGADGVYGSGGGIAEQERHSDRGQYAGYTTTVVGRGAGATTEVVSLLQSHALSSAANEGNAATTSTTSSRNSRATRQSLSSAPISPSLASVLASNAGASTVAPVHHSRPNAEDCFPFQQLRIEPGSIDSSSAFPPRTVRSQRRRAVRRDGTIGGAVGGAVGGPTNSSELGSSPVLTTSAASIPVPESDGNGATVAVSAVRMGLDASSSPIWDEDGDDHELWEELGDGYEDEEDDEHDDSWVLDGEEEDPDSSAAPLFGKTMQGLLFQPPVSSPNRGTRQKKNQGGATEHRKDLTAENTPWRQERSDKDAILQLQQEFQEVLLETTRDNKRMDELMPDTGSVAVGTVETRARKPNGTRTSPAQMARAALLTEDIETLNEVRHTPHHSSLIPHDNPGISAILTQQALWANLPTISPEEYTGISEQTALTQEESEQAVATTPREGHLPATNPSAHSTPQSAAESSSSARTSHRVHKNPLAMSLQSSRSMAHPSGSSTTSNIAAAAPLSLSLHSSLRVHATGSLARSSVHLSLHSNSRTSAHSAEHQDGALHIRGNELNYGEGTEVSSHGAPMYGSTLMLGLHKGVEEEDSDERGTSTNSTPNPMANPATATPPNMVDMPLSESFQQHAKAKFTSLYQSTFSHISADSVSDTNANGNGSGISTTSAISMAGWITTVHTVPVIPKPSTSKQSATDTDVALPQPVDANASTVAVAAPSSASTTSATSSVAKDTPRWETSYPLEGPYPPMHQYSKDTQRVLYSLESHLVDSILRSKIPTPRTTTLQYHSHHLPGISLASSSSIATVFSDPALVTESNEAAAAAASTSETGATTTVPSYTNFEDCSKHLYPIPTCTQHHPTNVALPKHLSILALQAMCDSFDSSYNRAVSGSGCGEMWRPQTFHWQIKLQAQYVLPIHKYAHAVTGMNIVMVRPRASWDPRYRDNTPIAEMIPAEPVTRRSVPDREDIRNGVSISISDDEDDDGEGGEFRVRTGSSSGLGVSDEDLVQVSGHGEHRRAEGMAVGDEEDVALERSHTPPSAGNGNGNGNGIAGVGVGAVASRSRGGTMGSQITVETSPGTTGPRSRSIRNGRNNDPNTNTAEGMMHLSILMRCTQTPVWAESIPPAESIIPVYFGDESDMDAGTAVQAENRNNGLQLPNSPPPPPPPPPPPHAARTRAGTANNRVHPILQNRRVRSSTAQEERPRARGNSTSVVAAALPVLTSATATTTTSSPNISNSAQPTPSSLAAAATNSQSNLRSEGQNKSGSESPPCLRVLFPPHKLLLHPVVPYPLFTSVFQRMYHLVSLQTLGSPIEDEEDQLLYAAILNQAGSEIRSHVWLQNCKAQFAEWRARHRTQELDGRLEVREIRALHGESNRKRWAISNAKAISTSPALMEPHAPSYLQDPQAPVLAKYVLNAYGEHAHSCSSDIRVLQLLRRLIGLQPKDNADLHKTASVTTNTVAPQSTNQWANDWTGGTNSYMSAYPLLRLVDLTWHEPDSLRSWGNAGYVTVDTCSSCKKKAAPQDGSTTATNTVTNTTTKLSESLSHTTMNAIEEGIWSTAPPTMDAPYPLTSSPFAQDANFTYNRAKESVLQGNIVIDTLRDVLTLAALQLLAEQWSPSYSPEACETLEVPKDRDMTNSHFPASDGAATISLCALTLPPEAKALLPVLCHVLPVSTYAQARLRVLHGVTELEGHTPCSLGTAFPTSSNTIDTNGDATQHYHDSHRTHRQQPLPPSIDLHVDIHTVYYLTTSLWQSYQRLRHTVPHPVPFVARLLYLRRVSLHPTFGSKYFTGALTRHKTSFEEYSRLLGDSAQQLPTVGKEDAPATPLWATQCTVAQALMQWQYWKGNGSDKAAPPPENSYEVPPLAIQMAISGSGLFSQLQYPTLWREVIGVAEAMDVLLEKVPMPRYASTGSATSASTNTAPNNSSDPPISVTSPRYWVLAAGPTSAEIYLHTRYQQAVRQLGRVQRILQNLWIQVQRTVAALLPIPTTNPESSSIPSTTSATGNASAPPVPNITLGHTTLLHMMTQQILLQGLDYVLPLLPALSGAPPPFLLHPLPMVEVWGVYTSRPVFMYLAREQSGVVATNFYSTGAGECSSTMQTIVHRVLQQSQGKDILKRSPKLKKTSWLGDMLTIWRAANLQRVELGPSLLASNSSSSNSNGSTAGGFSAKEPIHAHRVPTNDTSNDAPSSTVEDTLSSSTAALTASRTTTISAGGKAALGTNSHVGIICSDGEREDGEYHYGEEIVAYDFEGDIYGGGEHERDLFVADDEGLPFEYAQDYPMYPNADTNSALPVDEDVEGDESARTRPLSHGSTESDGSDMDIFVAQRGSFDSDEGHSRPSNYDDFDPLLLTTTQFPGQYTYDSPDTSQIYLSCTGSGTSFSTPTNATRSNTHEGLSSSDSPMARVLRQTAGPNEAGVSSPTSRGLDAGGNGAGGGSGALAATVPGIVLEASIPEEEAQLTRQDDRRAWASLQDTITGEVLFWRANDSVEETVQRSARAWDEEMEASRNQAEDEDVQGVVELDDDLPGLPSDRSE